MYPKLNFKKNDFETFEFLSVQYYQEAFISMVNSITNDEDKQREKICDILRSTSEISILSGKIQQQIPR